MTYKITLVNMPFAEPEMPSLALTQLKSVLTKELGDRVSVQVLNLNHDFANYFGFDPYKAIATGIEHYNAGLGEWLFRRAAFPEQEDNTGAYLQRHYHSPDPGTKAVVDAVLERRDGIEDFLEGLVVRYGILRADLVGCTSMFSQSVSSFALARAVKDENPDVVTVMGGANCESPMGEEIARNVPWVDYVFSGPGLHSFPELVRRRIEGDIEGCERIDGVFSAENLGEVRVYGKEKDINDVLPLDYDSFVTALERSFPDRDLKPVLTVETSRGCWWGERAHCTFCGLNGESMGYRSMEPGLAVDLLTSLFRYRTRLQVVDNILPRNYVRDVMPHLEPPAGTSLFYEVKVGDLHDAELATLARAGVTHVQPGIEALNTRVLKLMKKGTTAVQNLAFLKGCLVHGVTPYWSLLVGFPGEPESAYESYVADLPKLVHLPPPFGAYGVRFDRYSPYFTKAGEYGLELEPMDFYSMVYPFPEASLENLAYYFQNLAGGEFEVLVGKWINKVRAKIAVWREGWSNGQVPRLYVKNGNGTGRLTIYDSRFGEPIEHELSETESRLVELLDEPLSASQVAGKLGDPDADVEGAVVALEDRGILLRESGRLVSLAVRYR